jgi:hypothetical protein
MPGLVDLLAKLSSLVTTIRRWPDLAEMARRHLAAQKIRIPQRCQKPPPQHRSDRICRSPGLLAERQPSAGSARATR